MWGSEKLKDLPLSHSLYQRQKANTGLGDFTKVDTLNYAVRDL